MASLNKVFLIGNLTRDPEVRKMPSGDDVADLRLAVNRRFRDRSGADREESLFINVTVYGSRAQVVARYLKKGSPIFIEGRLRYEEWVGKDGQRQNRTSVVAENFEFLGGGSRGDTPAGPAAGDAPAAPSARAGEPAPAEPDKSAPRGLEGAGDAENLPF